MEKICPLGDLETSLEAHYVSEAPRLSAEVTTSSTDWSKTFCLETLGILDKKTGCSYKHLILDIYVITNQNHQHIIRTTTISKDRF